MIDKEFIAVFHYDDGGSKRCGAEPYRYAEEIVRCRECKNWNGVSYGCMRNPSVEGWQPDDFCSYGSRSEKPNNCDDEFKLYDREDLIALIEAQRERIAELLKDEPQTERSSE